MSLVSVSGVNDGSPWTPSTDLFALSIRLEWFGMCRVPGSLSLGFSLEVVFLSAERNSIEQNRDNFKK